MVHFEDDLRPAIEDELGLLTADEVTLRSGDPDAVDGLMSLQRGGTHLHPGSHLDPAGRPLPVFRELGQLADRHDVPMAALCCG